MRPWLFLSVFMFWNMRLSAAEPTLEGSRQCVLVLANDWPATDGTLRLLERTATGPPWRMVRGPWPVLLGRHGLAPASGLTLPHAPAGKREGDGRSPAGVFALGTAFGFTRVETRLPFLLLTPDTVAIDDAASRYYTQIVDRAAIHQPDWRSAEPMRAIPHYRLGLAVEYNTAPPVRDAGSCIFLHCFAQPRKATSGCTALAEEHLAALLAWLDPAARPRLVQLPRVAYATFQPMWGLPALPPEP